MCSRNDDPTTYDNTQRPPKGAALSTIRAWDRQQARERLARINAAERLGRIRAANAIVHVAPATDDDLFVAPPVFTDEEATEALRAAWMPKPRRRR